MVKPPDVPEHDVAVKHLGHELGRLMAVVAHPQVLGHPNGGARRRPQQPERDGQLLAVAPEHGRLVAVVHVVQHARRVRRVPLPPHLLPERAHALVHLRARRVRRLAGREPVDRAVQLDPAAPRLLRHASPPHPAPHLRRLGPLPGGGVDVAEERVVAGLLGLQLQQPLGGDLAEADVLVQPARAQQRAPRRHLLLAGLHRGHDGVGLVEPAGAAEDVHHAGVDLRRRRDAVVALHGVEQLEPALHHARVAARRQGSDEGHFVGAPLAARRHPVEQRHGLAAEPVHAVRHDEDVPGDGVPPRQPVEHCARQGQTPALGVHVHQRAPDGDVSVERVPHRVPVYLLPLRRRCQHGAPRQERHQRDGVRRHAGEAVFFFLLLHLADELERVVDIALDDATGDEGVPGHDVGEVDHGEDPVRDVRLAEARVHVHERVLHESVVRHAALHHVPVHGLLPVEGLRAGACRQHAGHGGLAGYEAGLGLHPRE
uniref:Uncharacterized protein n=1 Tax=Oryza brachyantha TaxID=4533 RepID=J3LVA8_ORYBR